MITRRVECSVHLNHNTTLLLTPDIYLKVAKHLSLQVLCFLYKIVFILEVRLSGCHSFLFSDDEKKTLMQLSQILLYRFLL